LKGTFVKSKHHDQCTTACFQSEMRGSNYHDQTMVLSDIGKGKGRHYKIIS